MAQGDQKPRYHLSSGTAPALDPITAGTAAPYYRSGAELGSHFTGVPGALSPAAPSLHRSTRILLFRIAFVGPYYMGFLPICQGACSLIPIPLWTNGTWLRRFHYELNKTGKYDKVTKKINLYLDANLFLKLSIPWAICRYVWQVCKSIFQRWFSTQWILWK